MFSMKVLGLFFALFCACNYSFDGLRTVMKSLNRTCNAQVQVFGLVGLTFYIEYLDVKLCLFSIIFIYGTRRRVRRHLFMSGKASIEGFLLS